MATLTSTFFFASLILFIGAPTLVVRARRNRWTRFSQALDARSQHRRHLSESAFPRCDVLLFVNQFPEGFSFIEEFGQADGNQAGE